MSVASRRLAGLVLGWVGLGLLTLGLVLWVFYSLGWDALGAWSWLGTVLAGVAALAVGSVLMRGTRSKAGLLDAVDADDESRPGT